MSDEKTKVSEEEKEVSAEDVQDISEETDTAEEKEEQKEASGVDGESEAGVETDTSDGGDVGEDDPAAEGDTEKKKLFGRKDKKEKKDKRDEKIEELGDQLKRQLAEFENFRNRSEREKAQRFEMGERNVLEKILPVVDNFERGFAGVDETSEDPFVKGMAQVYKQLQNVLTDLGVEPIEAVGCDFDPNLHNAVMQAQSDELESGKVAAELQKGYKFKDSVLRHSMVSVVQ